MPFNQEERAAAAAEAPPDPRLSRRRENQIAWVNEERRKQQLTAKHLDEVTRLRIQRTIRRLVRIQEQGCLCPTCEEGSQRIAARDYLAYTKALHMNLDKLGVLMEVEDVMAEPEPEQRLDLTTEAGIEHFVETELTRLPIHILARLHPKRLEQALRMAERRTA
ncbi:MAG: hypothetical protein AAFV53_00295 [Myxococcota bacterium]